MSPTIPQFPDFKPVGLELQPEISDFVDRFPPYSDFNFVSLFSWNTDSAMSVSWLKGNLVLACTDYLSAEQVCSFLGDNNQLETARILLEELPASPLRFVPEVSAQELAEQPDVVVAEDPDHHDYLVSAAALASLRGNRQAHTREAANRFHRDHGAAASFSECDLEDPDTHEQIRTVFSTREQFKGGDAQKELAALDRSLIHLGGSSMQGFGVFIDEQLQAFITAEQVNETTAIAHFSKANTQHKGIYQYLMHNLACALEARGIHTLNIEQDLGIPGLRASKQYLRPTGYLKKYSVSSP